MEPNVQFNRILLVLLLIACTTRATVVENWYRRLEAEQYNQGKTGAELDAKTNTHCALMCQGNNKCVAYQYTETRAGNCIIIQSNCTHSYAQASLRDNRSVVFENVNWIQSPGWTGPDAALYWSFDNVVGLIFMEGSEQKDYVSFVSGKVKCALTLDHTKRQWIDLGTHTEACMTRPDTCGAAAGAISVWVNGVSCPSPWDGIISSNGDGNTRGSIIFCRDGKLTGRVYLQDGKFSADYPKPSGWNHFLLNYIGPNNGDGIRVYNNGVEVASSTTKTTESFPAGDARAVVGKFYTNGDRLYASVEVDELVYFNKTLSIEEIKVVFNAF